MTDKEVSDDKNNDEFRQSVDASKIAIRSGGVALWNFIKGMWKFIERQHPFVQLLFTLPVAYAMRAVFSPFADWFYMTFWGRRVIVEGSLHISGIPIPLSWMIYILILLLSLTMMSSYNNKKQIQKLQNELSE